MRRGDQPAMERVLGELDEGVRESYADVRELLVHFRTRANEDDIEPALRTTPAKFEHQTGLHARLELEGHGVPLAPDVQVQVLHIVQEALSNVRKHAGAREVVVRVTPDAAVALRGARRRRRLRRGRRRGRPDARGPAHHARAGRSASAPRCASTPRPGVAAAWCWNCPARKSRKPWPRRQERWHERSRHRPRPPDGGGRPHALSPRPGRAARQRPAPGRGRRGADAGEAVRGPRPASPT